MSLRPCTLAYVGLGGNREDPPRQLAAALHRLATWPGVSRLRSSRLYRSPPWGCLEQPDFVNAVAELCYSGAAAGLLAGLLAIEREAGRVRGGSRWGPRRLDLDLLLFGAQRIDLPGLTVPHPHLLERAFVVLPLAELAPNLDLANGRSAAAHAAAIDAGGVVALV